MRMNNEIVRRFVAIAGFAYLCGCASSPQPLGISRTIPVQKSPGVSTGQVIETFQGLLPVLALVGAFAQVEGDTVHCQCVGGPKPEGVPPQPKMPGETEAIQNAINVLNLMLKAGAQSQTVYFIPDATATSKTSR